MPCTPEFLYCDKNISFRSSPYRRFEISSLLRVKNGLLKVQYKGRKGFVCVFFLSLTHSLSRFNLFTLSSFVLDKYVGQCSRDAFPRSHCVSAVKVCPIWTPLPHPPSVRHNDVGMVSHPGCQNFTLTIPVLPCNSPIPPTFFALSYFLFFFCTFPLAFRIPGFHYLHSFQHDHSTYTSLVYLVPLSVAAFYMLSSKSEKQTLRTLAFGHINVTNPRLRNMRCVHLID